MKQIFIALILISTVTASQAQVAANSELKSFINQSFSYFPRIKEVENTVATAKQKLDIASIHTPEVDATASYRFLEPKIVIPLGAEEFQFAPVHNVDGHGDVNYLLFDFGRLKADIEKSKTEIQFAEHNVSYAKYQLASQVSTIYYNIVYLQHAISIQDSVLRFLNENETFVQNKYNNGDALKIDILSIKTQIDAEQNRKVDLQNSLVKQQNLLSYTTGLKQTSGNAFDFDVPLKEIEGAIADAQANNPDFLLAKDKVKEAQNEVAISKLGNKPNVVVGAEAGVKNGYLPDVGQFRFNYNAGVAIKIPIYEGNRTKKQVALSESMVKQNELAIETLNSNYRKDIEQALTDLSSNLERIKNTEGQIEEAKYANTLAQKRFQNGVGTNLELTNASTNLQRAELTKLQYQYQLCLAKVELARLLGYKYW
jgi:outer membrane protein TolC